MSSRRAWKLLLSWATLWGACGPSVSEVSELDAPLAHVEQQVNRGWHTRWLRRSAATLEGNVFAGRLATDRDDASILVGNYQGSPDFGSGPLPPEEDTSRPRAFIVKYARNGQLLWAHGYGAPAGSEFPETEFGNVTVDRQRNITVYGYAELGADFGGVSVGPGFFLAQFSHDGTVRWARHLQGYFGFASGLTVDGDDNILLAGSMSGTADFGGGPRSASVEGAFFVKYTRDGAYVVDRVFDTPDTSVFWAVTTDEHNFIHVAGYFTAESDFGGGPLHPGSPFGGETAVVARYTPSGGHVWSRTLEGMTDMTKFHDVAVHGNRVVVTGEFRGRFKFGGHTFTARPVGSSGLVLAMTRNGGDRWGQTLGGSVMQVDSAQEDGMTVLGYAFPSDDVGTGPLPSTSSLYSVVSRFTWGQGHQQRVRTFSSDGAPMSALSVTRHGDVTLAGSFSMPVDFGTGKVEPSLPRNYDAFIFRME
ncbi:hypothetical protein [Hyalangium minutum]|uniref:Cell surface protein n=1 Tax=Hyalangium minutum TaxID=394096 RepID=A0A085WMN8_9BACT|nr:hypothetical protein [Hyalangium minutum]KFE68951.1 cell surface protein [Hyalangium minutum]